MINSSKLLFFIDFQASFTTSKKILFLDVSPGSKKGQIFYFQFTIKIYFLSGKGFILRFYLNLICNYIRKNNSSECLVDKNFKANCTGVVNYTYLKICYKC